MSDVCTQAECQQEAQKEYWPLVNLRMPPECLRQLKDYAESHYIGVSAVIRTSLIQTGIITPAETKPEQKEACHG